MAFQQLDFDTLYAANYRSVVALVFPLVRDRRVAEDVASEAFVEAFRSRRKLAAHPRPDLWVRRAAISRATSVLRRRTVEQRALTRLDAIEPHEPEESTLWLLELIRSLPRRQKVAFALVNVADHSIEEAAQVMGCSESTVRTHLERARVTLRETIRSADRPLSDYCNVQEIKANGRA